MQIQIVSVPTSSPYLDGVISLVLLPFRVLKTLSSKWRMLSTNYKIRVNYAISTHNKLNVHCVFRATTSQLLQTSAGVSAWAVQATVALQSQQ